MKDFFLESHDGKKIHCYIWDDVASPKGVVQLSHGMSEHAARYAPFAEFMNHNGYIVFADDHRAHGLTETDENRGCHEGNIFDLTRKDLVFFHYYLAKEYGLKQVFIGHSYGSFLGQAFAQSGTDVKAIALLGTAHMGRALMTFAMCAIAPFALICPRWRPKFVNKASDLLFDGKYKATRVPVNG